MSAPKQYLWECPNGCPAVRAPGRPRKDDVRRFCLPCSAKTGRLVERSAPSLEKQRAAKAQAAAEKRKARERKAREKEIAARTIAGVDIVKETERLMKLPAFSRLRTTPTFKVRRFSSMPSKLGHAEVWRNHIQMHDYPGCTREDVEETLVHELVHLITRHECDRAHDNVFQDKMAECFEAAYGCRAFGARRNRYHGRYARGLRLHRMTVEQKLAEAERLDAEVERIEAEMAKVLDPKERAETFFTNAPEQWRREALAIRAMARQDARRAANRRS